METLSERIFRYAKEVNMHCNTILYYSDKDINQARMAHSFFSSAISDFYNLVHQNKGMSLINCDTQHLKEIGLAYIKIAKYYKAGSQDWYVNSVSAENAFYCLVRYYKETDDCTSLPFLFLLLNENKSLLDDKFEQSWKSLHPRIVRLPFGMGLSGDVMLSACVRYYYIYVQHFILSKFYDFQNDRILITDKVLDLYYPDFAEIVNRFNQEYIHYDNDEYAKNRKQLGETYYNEIYKQCEVALIEN